jgi:hypothetical protein
MMYVKLTTMLGHKSATTASIALVKIARPTARAVTLGAVFCVTAVSLAWCALLSYGRRAAFCTNGGTARRVNIG